MWSRSERASKRFRKCPPLFRWKLLTQPTASLGPPSSIELSQTQDSKMVPGLWFNGSLRSCQFLYLGRPAASPGISAHGSWIRAAMVLPGKSRRWKWPSRPYLGRGLRPNWTIISSKPVLSLPVLWAASASVPGALLPTEQHGFWPESDRRKGGKHRSGLRIQDVPRVRNGRSNRIS